MRGERRAACKNFLPRARVSRALADSVGEQRLEGRHAESRSFHGERQRARRPFVGSTLSGRPLGARLAWGRPQRAADIQEPSQTVQAVPPAPSRSLGSGNKSNERLGLFHVSGSRTLHDCRHVLREAAGALDVGTSDLQAPWTRCWGSQAPRAKPIEAATATSGSDSGSGARAQGGS